MMLRMASTCCTAAALALALALPVTPAFAADIPTMPPQPRSPVAVTAPSNWYGFYIGVQGGYGWGSGAIGYAPNAGYAGALGGGALPGPVADEPKGFLGGITYGTNWQFGNMVLGTESDWSFSTIKQSQTLGPLPGFTLRVTGVQELKHLSTSRGRLGFLVSDNLLIFGTGGLASGGVEGSSQFNLVAPAVCAGAGNCPAGSRDKTLWGWSAGGGIEFAQGPWSVKLDYIHYDLGKLRYNVTDPTFPAGVISASQRVSGDVVRGGIAYRFNWTPLGLIFGTDRLR
jgi:outer membrane immunogenic protein